jgi:uncharacterized phage protein gp47/JayE
MSTLPLSTLAAQISATGISAPAFEDLLNSEIATYQSIYGSDTVLTADTQDGQLLSIRATAINDLNQLAIAVYNSFSPGYAQGVGLSAIVQINGLKRVTPTNSTVPLEVSGVVGTVIQDGVVIDTSGNLWDLPATVTIPESGEITVTGTAQTAGAIAAAIGAVNQPYTIITGWQSVTNPSAATPGVAVETDAALRQRQAASTSLPAQTPLQSIAAAIANLTGVGRILPYENQGATTDANGVPSHSIAMVIEGGDVTTIAETIEQKKAPGTGTYGSTSVTVSDPAGIPITINFFELTEVPIYVAVTIQPLTGYVSTTGTAIIAAIVAFLNALAIGQEVYLNWLLGVAGLNTSSLGQTFAITSLTIGISPAALAAANIPIAFNAAAQGATANVTLTVL